MLIIGSKAMQHWGLLREGREVRDTDIICTFAEFQQESKRIRQEEGIQICVPLSANKYHIRNSAGWNYEFEIAWPGSSGAVLLEHYEGVAPHSVLYALKMSHRYLRNSPHFLKTMRDIQHMREVMSERALASWTTIEHEWFAQREKETYTYAHPKLDVQKEEFFDDSVGYIYDHDTIHLAVALIGGIDSMESRHPAYTFYMQDGAQVMTDKDKFYAVDEELRMLGVYEESCVLALERSQIPNNFEGPSASWSFHFALMKVCTSITSGWFREYAWENYDKVVDFYKEMGESDYIDRFKRNQHLLKPFKGEIYASTVH